MITRKHLFFAIAATCLLTTFLFGVMPIRSVGYDPSLDENHDGKIDGKDIALPASIFGTAGDPMVPVNVTNWPQTYSLQTGTVNISSIGWNDPVINCSGYSRLSLLIPGDTNASIGAGNNVTIFLQMITWRDSPYANHCVSFDSSLSHDVNITIFNGYRSWVAYLPPFVIETKAPYCSLALSAIPKGILPPVWWATFEYAVYLRNE